VIAVDDLALDLRRLDAIGLIETESGPAVRVGSGCQLNSFNRDTRADRVDEIIVNQREQLWAARCSHGCLGVITEVEFSVREQYRIEVSVSSIDPNSNSIR
jgi:FAD/FMN-containing dehydrogenase